MVLIKKGHENTVLIIPKFLNYGSERWWNIFKKISRRRELEKKQWNGEKTTVRGWGETPNGYIKNLY
jgi:hypothetical protein